MDWLIHLLCLWCGNELSRGEHPVTRSTLHPCPLMSPAYLSFWISVSSESYRTKTQSGPKPLMLVALLETGQSFMCLCQYIVPLQVRWWVWRSWAQAQAEFQLLWAVYCWEAYSSLRLSLLFSEMGILRSHSYYDYSLPRHDSKPHWPPFSSKLVLIPTQINVANQESGIVWLTEGISWVGLASRKSRSM